MAEAKTTEVTAVEGPLAAAKVPATVATAEALPDLTAAEGTPLSWLGFS